MLLIEGGKTIDVLHGVSEARDWVILESGRIVSRADAQVIIRPDRFTRLDASGHYLVPGLIDAHVHLGRPRQTTPEGAPQSMSTHVTEVASQTIRGGVTLVRDLGDRWPHGLKVAEAMKQLDAPRVMSALGGLSAPNGYGRFLGEAVRDSDDLLAAVHRRYEAGAGVIKLFLTGGVDFATGTAGPVHFERRTVALAASAAHDLGLPLAVHANGVEAVMDAILAGADTIEHGILVDDDGLRAMADHGVVWVPTLTPLWRALQAATGHTSDNSAIPLPALRRVFERHQESVSKAFDLGIKVLAGTDAGAPGVPHGCLSDELGLFVAAGVHPATALVSATLWAAEALGARREAGSIETGRRADILLLRHDPLRDISAVAEISQVICGGKVVAVGSHSATGE